MKLLMWIRCRDLTLVWRTCAYVSWNRSCKLGPANTPLVSSLTQISGPFDRPLLSDPVQQQTSGSGVCVSVEPTKVAGGGMERPGGPVALSGARTASVPLPGVPMYPHREESTGRVDDAGRLDPCKCSSPPLRLGEAANRGRPVPGNAPLPAVTLRSQQAPGTAGCSAV